ncbi:uncharacterized protein LOC130172051 [Seriola aureovittata]|uniref:uncharacterized protein LOC130172051 n=1 Tax=Seriola aureovittata TaxID=2871759 RepID=UPI0024BE5982|nr:uncharacterized protein LOC130172051 [Seriola aureovittata]
MSVYEEKSESAEFNEQIEFLQEELKGLNDQLLSQTNEDERENLELRIGDILAKLEILKVTMAEPIPTTSQTVETRKSSRERKLTPKMQELQQQELSQKEKKFLNLYEKWKEQVKTARTNLKEECPDENLCNMMDAVECLETQVRDSYENVRSQLAPSTEIRRKMDSCTAVTRDLMELMKVRMSEVGLEEFDAKVENARLHLVLDKEYAQSIFGSSRTKTTVRSQHSNRTADQQSITAKRAECVAQLAAKKAEMNMEEAIAAQRHELKRLENQRDLNVIAAKIKAYSEADSDEICSENKSVDSKAARSPPVPFKEIKEEQTCQNSNEQANNANNETSLIQALRDTMVLTRLPTPEPSVFFGDPLKFIEWKTSFKALIECRCTNPADKLFYLQRYISGEARSVVEGSFYRKDEDAYNQAWEALNARYGHSFVIQRAFRDKLNNWPKINSRESLKLRQFSDFLNTCSNAMPHVKGLQVLNDCEENQKMLQKLPEWLISRWNRHVTKQLRKTEEYPNFKEFAEFVATEADITCNPVTSLQALKSVEERPSRDVKRQRASAFSTSVKADGLDKPVIVMKTSSDVESNSKGSNAVKKVNMSSVSPNSLSCLCCEESHSIHKCPTLSSKPVEEKRRFILDNNLCFGCLRRGHISKDCRNKSTCGICKKSHPTPLHESRAPAAETTSHAVNADEKTSSLSCSINRVEGESTSMIVPVWISLEATPESETLVYALLDTQSSNTFVDQGVCERIGAGSEPVKLKLTTMMARDSIIQSERVSGLRVRGFASNSFIDLPPAYSRDFIPLERSHIPTPATAKKWKHLINIAQEIPELMDCEVGLLIGYDCPRVLAPRHVITGSDDEPYGIKTDLGWSIVGNSSRVANSSEVTGLCHRVSVRELPPLTPPAVIRALEADFKDTYHGEKSISQDDIQFMHLLNEQIQQNADGHLEMPLPFKTRPQLPENKGLALVRLNQLKRKFEKNLKFKEDYIKFMDGVFKDGDAERADNQPKAGNVWYIPHQGVYHPRKPEKIRVVFDCSAKYGGTALNDHLLSGPDLTNGLTGVLCRFRKYPVAVICDVEKMFHRFHVSSEDRDYLRFLWWENGDTKSEPKDYRMRVHLFGAASSPGCSNYGLKYLASQNEKDYPAAASFIKRNFYVDDGLISVESVDSAIKLVREAQTVCAKGKLHLHKFISNNREVLESVPDSDRAKGVQDVDLNHGELPVQTVLGVKWSVDSDTFSFKVALNEKSTTRRGILSTIASVFDPLGFLAPFLLQGKKILQEMCQKGIGWDEQLPAELKPRWESWLNDLEKLQELQIPRCFAPENLDKAQRVELHHFSDASSHGYGQCSYLRVVMENKVHCSLVIVPIRGGREDRASLMSLLLPEAGGFRLGGDGVFNLLQAQVWTSRKADAHPVCGCVLL